MGIPFHILRGHIGKNLNVNLFFCSSWGFVVLVNGADPDKMLHISSGSSLFAKASN